LAGRSLVERKLYGTGEEFTIGMRQGAFRATFGWALVSACGAMLNCSFHIVEAERFLREIPLSESKHDESFKVVDHRLFTAEGEFRKDVAEQQDRERETAPAAAPANAPGSKTGPAGSATNAGKPPMPGATPATEPPADAPKRSPAFENLIRSLGQNAAMLLGGYADPRTGQPVLDLEGAREMIDMLDVLREKTHGNLAPEEDSLLLDVLGNLKLAFMEMAKAAAKQEKAQSRP
jgi:hypothetical protein